MIEALLALQPPMNRIVENKGCWKSAASAIAGIEEFPSDYKELINRFGTMCFGEFIWVHNPFSENPHIRLDNQIVVRRSALKFLARKLGETVRYDIDSLLPWFTTDNGDVGYWIVEGNWKHWKTTVNESRGELWHETNSSTVEFLCGLLEGSEKCPLFPNDFPPRA